MDDSFGHVYRDIGLSLEAYGDSLAARLNGYVPVGTTERLLDDALTNPRHAGHDLLYDQVLRYQTALARPVPSKMRVFIADIFVSRTGTRLWKQ